MLYKLKNEYGILVIKPKDLSFHSAVQEEINQVTDAKFKICDNNNTCLFDEKDQKITHDGTPIFYENQDIHFIFVPKKDKNHKFSLCIRGVEQQFELPEGQSVFGFVNFKNAVGWTDISIRDKTIETDIINSETEVFPIKVDYKKDFDEMLQEITEIIYNLAFDYFKKTYLPTKPIDTTNQKLNEWVIILKDLFDEIIRCMDIILKNLHSKIEITKTIKEVSRVRKIDRRIEKWILKNRRYFEREVKGSICYSWY